MSKSLTTKILIPMALALVAVTACGGDKKESAASSLLTSDDTILRYIAADTPYVFANVEPMPDDVMDKIEPRLDEILRSYQTVLREIIANKRREAASRAEADPEQEAKIDAFVDEFVGLLSIDGIRGAGIGRAGTAALYGNGLLPVMRLQLTDGALFDAAIARLEDKAGYKLPVAAIEGGGYRYADADGVRFIIAILEDQAVITVVPESLGDDGIQAALGLTLPATSIADSGVLQAIKEHYGFTSHFIGLVDVPAITAALTDPQGVNAAFLSATDHDTPQLSDVCKAEIREVAGIMPRMVLGYDELSVDQLASTIVLELRNDIATDASKLAAPVPGLGRDPGGLMAFGMSLDVKAARDFVGARIQAMKADPFECELFADVQAATAGAEAALARPVPPMVNDFKGFLAIIDELEGLDLATQTPPTSIAGRFLLAMDNAQALVAMGAMFSPDIAGLNLQPDGKPVPLALPQLQAMGMTAFAALNNTTLAVAVGEDSEANLTDMMSAAVGNPLPVMSFSMDAARYYAFIGEAIAVAEPGEGEDAPSPEMQAALRDIMNAVGKLYERMTFDVYFTANGIEIKAVEVLAD